MDLLKRASNHQLLRYIAVGGTAYVLEMASLFGLKKVAGLGNIQAVAVSFWFGLLVAFFMQKIITFRNKHFSAKHLTKQGLGYAALVLWNYGFTILVVALLQHRLSVFVVRTFAILCITLWNYRLYHYLFHHD